MAEVQAEDSADHSSDARDCDWGMSAGASPHADDPVVEGKSIFQRSDSKLLMCVQASSQPCSEKTPRRARKA